MRTDDYGSEVTWQLEQVGGQEFSFSSQDILRKVLLFSNISEHSGTT